MNSSNQQPEGVDGTVMFFRERLLPGFGICAFISVMTISLGVAYGHAYGTTTGLAVGTLTTLLVVGGLFVNAPIIAVDDHVIRAGKARLPLQYTGEVRHLDQQATKLALRENAHHQAYLLVRSWVNDSIVLTVTDTTDPHPYWQISTRKTDELLRAIDSAKQINGEHNG